MGIGAAEGDDGLTHNQIQWQLLPFAPQTHVGLFSSLQVMPVGCIGGANATHEPCALDETQVASSANININILGIRSPYCRNDHFTSD
jgi:hypothetical protein